MLIQRSSRHRPPASVAESWRRIEAWLGEHLPVLILTLRPGISKKDLTKFEESVGRRLPDDVRESWLIHGGQRPVPYLPDDPSYSVEDEDDLLRKGIVFGYELMPLLDREGCLSKFPALGHWRFWAERVDKAERGEDEGMLAEFGEVSTSSPEGAIRRLHASRAWIPLVRMNDSNLIGTDLDPGPCGAVGQVINFGRDQEEKYVLAGSWAHFLEDLAEELEAGNFVITEAGGTKSFDMREPRPGELWLNLKEWSEAKLDPKSMRNGPSP